MSTYNREERVLSQPIPFSILLGWTTYDPGTQIKVVRFFTRKISGKADRDNFWNSPHALINNF